MGLVAGLGLAIILVYLLIVVNFQSWLDPFIIISALPAALAGIVWMLFATHTTISVPALTGAIMCMGVATANSILVVSFAKDELARGRAPLDAALDAGFGRFRPVLMTALAMIIGMVPMALGFGEGRRAECAARARGHRRPDVRHRRDAVLRARGVRPAPPQDPYAAGDRCMTTLPPPDPAPDPRPRRSKGPIVTVIVLVIAGALVGRLGHRRARRGDDRARRARPASWRSRRVVVTTPSRGTASEEVALPGNIQPYTDAAIFARTTGYLKARYADIGSSVKAGQVLAEIDTPEIDQQLLQARADLATAKANEGLARTTAERYQDLIKTDSVSRQDLDNANGSYEAKKAAVLSADANVKRLEELQRFKTIHAPFAGVITARNTDIGALIGSGSAAKELFHIARWTGCASS